MCGMAGRDLPTAMPTTIHNSTHKVGYGLISKKALQINDLRCLCFLATGKLLAKGLFEGHFSPDFDA
jgi:hypothetical protein